MESTSQYFKERTRLGNMSTVRNHLTPSIPPSGAAGVVWLKAGLSTSFSGLTARSGSLSYRIRSKPCMSFRALHSCHPPLRQMLLNLFQELQTAGLLTHTGTDALPSLPLHLLAAWKASLPRPCLACNPDPYSRLRHRLHQEAVS